MRPSIVVRPAGRRALPPRSPLEKGTLHLISADSRRRPFFSSCWSMIPMPREAEVLDSYTVLGARISMLRLAGGSRHMYHMVPWEYTIPDAWMGMIRETVGVIHAMPPERMGTSMEELRQQVVSRARELLGRMSESGEGSLPRDPMERMENLAHLSEVIGRYTVGLGIMEILLSDERVEDVFVDAPCSSNPVHVTLGGIGGSASVLRCPTNITATEDELEGLASRLRQYSGKPFSQAFPVMETDVPGFETRATLIGPPLSPDGRAMALRRRSRSPWTLTRMIHNGTMDSMTAGLLSFLMDGSSTILIAGARGSGKSSLLSAMLFEFPLSQRILIIEDTAELPVSQMQEMGFNVQSLIVEQGIGERMEIKTEEALRVSLRLGESAIVLGEVRGREAQTLYEGMRTGRAGSSVLGTIHGDSAVSVFERVVHDMGIVPQAFGATDVIVTMGMVRPGGSQNQVRGVMEISELAKERGPGEFNRLGWYDPSSASLRLDLDGSETLERIARSWGITPEEAVENVRVRARLREMLVSFAHTKGQEYLEPRWLLRSNEFLWQGMGSESDPGCHCEDFDRWLLGRSGVEAIR